MTLVEIIIQVIIHETIKVIIKVIVIIRTTISRVATFSIRSSVHLQENFKEPTLETTILIKAQQDKHMDISTDASDIARVVLFASPNFNE